MKFVNYLEQISGVSIFPIISLFLFITLFIIAVLYAMRASDETISEMENLPLDDN